MKILVRYCTVTVLLLLMNAAAGTDTISADDPLGEYFYPPERSFRMVKVTCRMTVPDNSPAWPKILLAGFAYASAHSQGEEFIAVAITEQDYITRVYSVRRNDFIGFMNDRLTILEFLRRIRFTRDR